jgi:hypothetical protein
MHAGVRWMHADVKWMLAGVRWIELNLAIIMFFKSG